MQLYLTGLKIIFIHFFVKDKNSIKINNKTILSDYKHLKNKDINQIMYAQKNATENTK